MKLKYNFVTNVVAGKTVAVAIGEDLSNFNGFIKMDENGAFIFNLLKNDITEDEIIAAVVKEYGVEDNSELREGVNGFIASLVKEGVIENA